MIGIFDDDGNRLPITWQGLDFNKAFDAYDTFNGGDQQGIFTDATNFNTPVNYQSEVHGSILKQGGGIEFYNPRIASRVLNIRARVQAATQTTLHEYLRHIQKLFSPLYLQYKYDGWPPSAGRPTWTDPWHANFKGLLFTGLGDGTLNTGWDSSGKESLAYAVAPLQLPDPPVAAIGQGWGASLDLAFMLLDAGVAHLQTATTVSGNGTASTNIGTVPSFPVIQFSMTGAGHASLTIAFTSSDPQIPNTSVVIDASGLSNNDDVVIYARDREVWVNGAIDNSILSTSTTWPVISPDYDVTITWTNTTNVTANSVKFREALSA